MKGIAECTFVVSSKVAGATLEVAMEVVAECTFLETSTAADATLEGAMKGFGECTYVESEVAGASLEVAMKDVSECTFVETRASPQRSRTWRRTSKFSRLRLQERVKEQREVLRDQRGPSPEQREEEKVKGQREFLQDQRGPSPVKDVAQEVVSYRIGGRGAEPDRFREVAEQGQGRRQGPGAAGRWLEEAVGV